MKSMTHLFNVGDSYMDESYNRKLVMIEHLQKACSVCTMCELGLKEASRNDRTRNPHVFSNMRPHRFMVVGQNPGWDELAVNEPFVGAAGKNFDTEVEKHGLSRNDFYICNAVRCYTAENQRPTEKHIERCAPFLRMEINLIKPRLLIALGSVAFEQLCPGIKFSQSLKTIVKSEKFGVSVFPIYHPSPVNFRDSSRKDAFQDQIALMCKLIKAIKKKDGIGD